MTHSFLLFKAQAPVSQTQALSLVKGALCGQMPQGAIREGEIHRCGSSLVVLPVHRRETSLISESSQSHGGDTQVKVPENTGSEDSM